MLIISCINLIISKIVWLIGKRKLHCLMEGRSPAVAAPSDGDRGALDHFTRNKSRKHKWKLRVSAGWKLLRLQRRFDQVYSDFMFRFRDPTSPLLLGRSNSGAAHHHHQPATMDVRATMMVPEEASRALTILSLPGLFEVNHIRLASISVHTIWNRTSTIFFLATSISMAGINH